MPTQILTGDLRGQADGSSVCNDISVPRFDCAWTSSSTLCERGGELFRRMAEALVGRDAIVVGGRRMLGPMDRLLPVHVRMCINNYTVI